MIKNFAILKNKNKKTDKHPDYLLSTKVNEEFIEIGAAYLKDTQRGEKYFSCSLKKEYQPPEGDVKNGFVIITDAEYARLKQVEEDYGIKYRNPTYPTPTDQGIDMRAHRDPVVDSIKPEDLDEVPF
jgi:hypothetical protein